MKEINTHIDNILPINGNKKSFLDYNVYVNFIYINYKIDKIHFFASSIDFIFKLKHILK